MVLRHHPVGRLDGDSSGLLLLSSEGLLTHRLLSPKCGPNPHVWFVIVKPTPFHLTTSQHMACTKEELVAIILDLFLYSRFAIGCIENFQPIGCPFRLIMLPRMRKALEG